MICSKCFIEKPSSDFSRDQRMMGVFARCIPCDDENTTRKQEELKSNHSDSRATVQQRYRLKSKYGITPEQYEQILLDQGNCCAIDQAKKPGGNGYWHVDFVDGVVRGLICQKCSIQLSGWIREDVAMVERLLAYLTKG